MNYSKLYVIIFILIYSCQTKNENISPFDQNKAISDIYNINNIKIQKLDTLHIRTFNYWNKLINISDKINRISLESNGHKSIVNAIKLDLEEVNKNNIPYPFNVPEIIGRLRVFKTFVYKINLYEINEENIVMYKDDIKKMIVSYNSLVEKLNSIVNTNN